MRRPSPPISFFFGLTGKLRRSPKERAMHGYARSAKPPAAAPATPEPADSSRAAERPAAGPHRFDRFALVAGEAAAEPLQRMSFARFAGSSTFSLAYWSTPYDAAETALLADEKRVGDLITSVTSQLEGAYAGPIQQIGEQLTAIKNATIDTPQYRATSSRLATLERTLNALLILRVVDTLVASLPASMRGADNESAILQALAPGATTREDVPDVASEHAVAFARQRVVNITDALNEVDQRLAIDRPGRVVAHIGLTGSDLHNRGRQVVIVTYATGEKEVYKPRSVEPDRALLGTGAESAFGFLNTLSDRVSLPTLALGTAGAGRAERGYAEFKTKVQVVSHAEARAYYEQLGQVAVASKLFGATDLHLDNVMITEGGQAAIIDAETSFLPYVMAADKFSATALPNALKEFTAGSKLGNNAFLTDDEIAEHGEEAYRPAAVDRIRENDLRGDGVYLPDFHRGVVQLLVTVLDNRPAIVERLWTLLGRTTKARYVPIDTSTFKGYVRGYHSALARKQPAEASETLDPLVAELERNLPAEHFALLPTANAFLRSALEADLKAGDIPIFHFSPQDNTLRLHGVTIGDSVLLRAGRDFVVGIVEEIAHTNPEQVVEDVLSG
jgi:hypothetical protein